MTVNDETTERTPAPADAEAVAAEVVSEQITPTERMARSRWQVLAMIFAVLGPLALPLLWRSPRFSKRWKTVLTVLVGVQTVLVVLVIWWFATWLVGEFAKLRELM